MTAKLTASADGSKVLIGTAAEDALQIDATAKTIKALAPYKLNPQQTWVNETANRAIGVTYTNNTGAPLTVAVVVTTPGSVTIGIELVVGAVTIANMFDGNNRESAIGFSLSGVVPAGSTYHLNNYSGASLTLGSWQELK
jgi:hypothetical protein